MKRVFVWKLKSSFSFEKEHILVYVSQYKEYEICQEIKTKMDGNSEPGPTTVIFYASKLEENFKKLDDLINFLNKRDKND